MTLPFRCRSARASRAALVPALLLVLASTACRGEAADTTTAAPEAAPAGTGSGTELAIDDAFQYEPEVLTVLAGTVVDVVNRATEAHSVTSVDGAPAAFDTGLLPEGGRAQLRLTVPGTYAFVCSRHPELMRGSIVVRPLPGGPDLPPGPIGGALTGGPVPALPPDPST